MNDENIDLMVDVLKSLRKNLDVLEAIYREENRLYKKSYNIAIKENPEDPDYDDSALKDLEATIFCLNYTIEHYPYTDQEDAE